MSIQELQTDAEIQEAFPVMHELRTHLAEDEFVTRVEKMRKTGYQLFALKDEGKIVALAGVAILDNLYAGKHLWVYDLVTTAEGRSHGYGRQLLTYLEEYARVHECQSVGLMSGTQRIDAHRFYEQHMGYERRCYMFEKRFD